MDSISLRKLQEEIELERKRLLGANVEELLRELIKQIKISNMDPQYWQIIPIDVDTPLRLSAGEYKVLIEERERGKVLAIGATFNSPDILIEAHVDDTRFTATIRQLYDWGLVGPNNAIYWLSRFDTINNVYTAWWTPSPPRDYMGYIKVIFYNIGSSDVQFTYSIYRYKLVER